MLMAWRELAYSKIFKLGLGRATENNPPCPR